jgi:hypothetical protein
MTILQAQIVALETASKASRTLEDYGLLGTLTIIMIGVILYMEKQRNSGVADLKLTIAKLDAKVDAQQKEQEAQQRTHVEFITNEYKLSMEINSRCLEVLSDVRALLRDRK